MKIRRHQCTNENDFSQSQSGLHPLAPLLRIRSKMADLRVELEVWTHSVALKYAKKNPATIGQRGYAVFLET